MSTLPRKWQNVRVRIVNPEFVVRVGYPNTVLSYLPKAIELYDDKLREVLGNLWNTPRPGDTGVKYRLRRNTLHDIAHRLAKKDGFGGSARTVHTIRREALQGNVYTVMATKRVVTGIYYGGHTSSSAFFAEHDDYEPPSLENAEHHLLLGLAPTLVAAFGCSTGTGLRAADSVWREISSLPTPAQVIPGAHVIIDRNNVEIVR
jgi:hypothetical protein